MFGSRLLSLTESSLASAEGKEVSAIVSISSNGNTISVKALIREKNEFCSTYEHFELDEPELEKFLLLEGASDAARDFINVEEAWAKMKRRRKIAQSVLEE